MRKMIASLLCLVSCLAFNVGYAQEEVPAQVAQDDESTQQDVCEGSESVEDSMDSM